MIPMAKQMKDSGVEWIGEIPDNWSVFKTLRLLDMPITDGPHETPSLYDEGIPFISAEAVSCGCGGIDFSRKRGYISREYYVECCKKYTPRLHDIYMIKSGATTGRVSMVDTEVEFAIWSPLAVFRANSKKIAPRYLFYSLQADYYQNQISLSWSFGTQQNIGMRVLEQLKLAVPVVEEQQKIVEFLDSKCTEIDKVVEQTRATIEEYKKLKQAIITDAVTKGVRGPRPMKPSGLEWIGDIPEEWCMKRFKYLGTYRNGLTYKPEELSDSGILVLRSSNIQNGQIALEDNVYVDSVIKDELKVRKGDILICSRNGSRELIGKNAIIKDDMDASFGAFMMIFRSNSPEYMRYILNSSVFSYYLASFFTATINQLTANNFGNMKVPFCSNLEEQKGIIDFLDAKCAEIDCIIEKKEQLIEELGSYKKSLIYEYVTGKKEVTA